MGQGLQDVKITYRLIAAGSVVEERIAAGTPMEMLTMYYDKAGKLSATHYCAMGNQPHMKAPGKGEDGKIAFAFTSGGNMKSDKEAHMHAVTFTFIDKDTLKTEWKHFADGKEVSTMVFDLKRKK